MMAASENPLVKFRAKDTEFGVTRSKLKDLSVEPDEGPLTARQIATLRKDAAKHLPKGKVLARQDLFK